MARRRAHQPGERGVALVEFALIAPLLFALLLGIVTGAIAYNRKITMSDAVREGARYGATLVAEDPLGACTTPVPATPTTWCDKVRKRVIDLSAGELTASQVCAALVDQPDTAGLPAGCSLTKPASPTGVTAGTRRVVKVWAARTAEIEAIIYSRTVTLTSSLAAQYERGTP